MGYVVQLADIVRDKPTLLQILVNNRETDYPYHKRYDWIYLQNPYGKAIAWVIWDEKKGIPVGFTSAFPREMLVQGKKVMCWNCGDFSIEKPYRTLGIAVKLRKAAKLAIEAGEMPFLYAHPNNRMVHVHLRVGHQKIAHMKRYALPIRLSKYLPQNAIAKGIGGIIDPILSSMARLKFRKMGDYEILSRKDMNFSSSHTSLCHALNDIFPVIGLRDEVYLNWKFREHPILDFYLFNYYEAGKLVGYIIYSVQKQSANLAEVLALPDDGMWENMVSTFIWAMLKQAPEVKSISVVTQEFNPVVPVLEKMGFRFRDDATSSVIAYTGDSHLRPFVLDGKKWFMTVGDRDS